MNSTHVNALEIVKRRTLLRPKTDKESLKDEMVVGEKEADRGNRGKESGMGTRATRPQQKLELGTARGLMDT